MDRVILVSQELGCAYRWSGESKGLEYCPMRIDNTFYPEDWGPVEEYAVGQEVVTYLGREMTFSEVYRDVESKLGVTV